MAQVEPMDIDAIESDFDNKENAFHHNNVLSRTPCTEKGYEELDVSELNMKLRYSVTPASSPMTKSLTGPYLDNRSSEDYLNNAIGAENGYLTRSLNSTLTKTEGLSKSKLLPLQTLSADPFVDRNSSICRLLDPNDNNVIIAVNNANDVDENLSLPSPCSSVPETPEATTPTKEIPKPEGSPIMRGLKSVLSMFRPSQSPILPPDNKPIKAEILSPVEPCKSEFETVQVSTPVAVNKERDGSSSKRSSPLKESLVFNEDLERELQWKDETTIIFKDERIPVHKLFFQNPITETLAVPKNPDTAVEHMDMSCDESVIVDKTYTSIEPSDNADKCDHPVAGESDNEFLDCETTFTKKDNETQMTGNLTLNLANAVDISTEINSDCKETVNVISGEITTSIGQPCLPDSNVCMPKMDSNPSNIIEATINLLISESNYYNKVDFDYNGGLENKSQLDTQPKDPDIPISNELQIIKDYGLRNTTEAESCTTPNLKTEFTASESLEDEEMRVAVKQVCCNIDHLPDVCAEALNNIDISQDRFDETFHIIATKEKIERVDDKTVPIKDTFDKLNMTNILGSTQFKDFDTNTDFLDNNKDIIVTGSTKKVVANNCYNVERILDECNKIIKDPPVTQDNKEEDDVPTHTVSELCIDNDSLNDVANNCNNVDYVLDDNYKIIENISIIQATKNVNDVPIETAILPPAIDFNNPKNSPTMQPTLSEELNSTNIEYNLIFPETNKLNDGNIETFLKNNEESVSLQISSIENEESEIRDNMQTSTVDVNTISIVNNTSNNCREVPEQIVESSTAISKSPSEIPLPDEDDIEQSIVRINDTYNKYCNKQAITILEICNKDSVVDGKNEFVADCTKSDQVRVTLDSIEGTSKINSINNYDTEITNNRIPVYEEVNNIQTCFIENAHVMTKAIDIDSENRNKVVLEISDNDILPKENLSKDISMSGNICMNVEQSVPKIESDTTETSNPINIVELSTIIETNLTNTKKCSDINSLDKVDETNKIIMGGNNEENFTNKKGIDDIDEEIITSANNSPYISVTDLDVIAQKMLKDPSVDIDNPFASNNKLSSSPPISPKIVSKGYNFNFDEVDDPFATKTKIRMSPTRDTPNQSFATDTDDMKTLQDVPKKVNRRKSHHERKGLLQKKKMNSTFNDTLTGKDHTAEKHINSEINSSKHNILNNIATPSVKENTSECKPNLTSKFEENCLTFVAQSNKIIQNIEDTTELVTSSAGPMSTSVLKAKTQFNDAEVKHMDQTLVISTDKKAETQFNDAEVKHMEQTLVISTDKSTSSSEQYFSLGTSSGESSGLMNRSKNVFNLPEIDDVNFNPFATKSKMRLSPPPAEKPISPLESINDDPKLSLVVQQQSDTNSTKTEHSERTFNEKITNDSSPNTNNTTPSSKNANDVDSTIREILTEDEDTVEGPFLEVDNLIDTRKLTDLEVEADTMNFEEIPQQGRDENLENGELFIDADAFVFLLNQNKSTTVSDSGKESLFLKFDPLFAQKVSSDGILAALSKVQKRQSTPKKVMKPLQKDLTSIDKPIAGPSSGSGNNVPIEEYHEDLSSIMTKPMMVVNPAVSSIITQKKSTTPKLNRRSLTFTSPAIAVIDRLLSLSANSSNLEHDVSVPQISGELSETDRAITQLRELLAEKEINVHSLRSESKELKDRLVALEVQLRSLETESAERRAKIDELNDRLLEKTKMNKSMAIVVEEYERTIASLIAETEQVKKRNAEEKMRLIKEKEEQIAHLTSMEASFSDLHSKYEKSKQIILSCKANEDIYNKSIKEFQDNFSKMQNNYELLKQHATSKLNHANQELEKMNRTHEAEVLKMNAMIKRKELHITSLEETLAQKTKANEELTAICDELINKVG